MAKEMLTLNEKCSARGVFEMIFLLNWIRITNNFIANQFDIHAKYSVRLKRIQAQEDSKDFTSMKYIL